MSVGERDWKRMREREILITSLTCWVLFTRAPLFNKCLTTPVRPSFDALYRAVFPS